MTVVAVSGMVVAMVVGTYPLDVNPWIFPFKKPSDFYCENDVPSNDVMVQGRSHECD